MAGKRKIPYEGSLDGAYVGGAAERRKRIVDAAEREARLFCTGALARALVRIGGPDGESLDGWLADAVMTAARDEGTPFVMARPHRPRKGDDDDDLVGLAMDDGSIEVDRVPDLDQALRLLGAAKGLAAGLRTLDGSDGVWYDFIMVYEAPGPTASSAPSSGRAPKPTTGCCSTACRRPSSTAMRSPGRPNAPGSSALPG